MNDKLIIDGESLKDLREYLRKAEEAQDLYMEEADKYAVQTGKVKALQAARDQRRAVVFHQIKMLVRYHDEK